jgi:hypothetical protein
MAGSAAGAGVIGLPNPWLILAAVLAIGAAGVAGDLHGAKRGADAVQVLWDKDSAARALKSAENTQRARDTQDMLQAAADKERSDHAQVLADLDDRLRRTLDELRKRPPRPAASGPGVVPAASAGTQGSTGLGLYREDAVFLAGEADTGKRVKLQRDACYAAYDRASAALEALKAGKVPALEQGAADYSLPLGGKLPAPP